MAAGMHYAIVLGGVGILALLLHGQRIHIGTQTNGKGFSGIDRTDNAALTVLFGVFNGVVVLISTLLEPVFVKIRKPLRMDELVFFRIFRSVRTFLIITVARVISLPGNIAIAGNMLLTMFGIRSRTSFFAFTGKMVQADDFRMYLPALFGCVILFLVSFLEEKGHSVRDLVNEKPMAVRVAVTAIGTAAIILFGAYGIGYEASSFIYSNY